MRSSANFAALVLAALALVGAAACSTNTPPPSEPSVPPSEPAAPAPTLSNVTSGAATSTEPATTSPARSKTGPAGAACGGMAGFGCAAGLYCAFALEAQCGAADQTGVCKVIPEMCTEQYSPVCGCNDKTFPNDCHAAREGIAVASNGPCAAAAASTALAEGQTCGTRGVQGECAPDQYCKYKSQCGATDSGGVCTKRPQICTKIYRPVCGCDGKTHPSDCVAASHGTAVKHDGPCKT